MIVKFRVIIYKYNELQTSLLNCEVFAYNHQFKGENYGDF